MSESNATKQSVTGFKVLSFSSRKTKDGEKIKVSIEGLVEDIGAGEKDIGDVLKALTFHQSGDVEIGLNLFVK